MLHEMWCWKSPSPVSYCTVRGDHEVVTGVGAGCTGHVGRTAGMLW